MLDDISQALPIIDPFTRGEGTSDDVREDDESSNADSTMLIRRPDGDWEAILLMGASLLSRSRSCAESDIKG